MGLFDRIRGRAGVALGRAAVSVAGDGQPLAMVLRDARNAAGVGNWQVIFDTTGQVRWPDNTFQTDQAVRPERVLAFSPVYACTTLIANDIGKLRQCLKKVGTTDGVDAGIEAETTSPAFSPVLASPNGYQNHIQFKQWWITSKLIHGNAYVLKARDARNVVVGLYILDPYRVMPLVAPDGSIYYRLSEDNLSGLEEKQVTVPASEIIHDRMNCLYHPLIGTPPLYAATLAATQGLGIQRDSLRFFSQGSNPGGVLTAPAQISDATAERARKFWEKEYGGPSNAGKVVVLGDGLTFEPMRMTSVDAQVAEQLKLDATFVAAAFHVPPFKVGFADIPPRQTVSDLNQIYYSDCLQSLIEEYELCMTEGLGAESAGYTVALDLDGLLRMDPATQIATLGTAVDKTIMMPNEARARLNLAPTPGGDNLFKQVQNYTVAQLADREGPAPSAGGVGAPGADPAPPEPAKPEPGKPPAEPAPEKALSAEAKEIASRGAFSIAMDALETNA